MQFSIGGVFSLNRLAIRKMSTLGLYGHSFSEDISFLFPLRSYVVLITIKLLFLGGVIYILVGGHWRSAMLAAVLGVVVLGLALALLFKRQVPLLLSSPPLNI